MLNSKIRSVHIILGSIFLIQWFDHEAEILAYLLIIPITFNKRHNYYNNYDNITLAQTLEY